MSTRTVLDDFHKTIFLNYYCVLINSKWVEKVFGKKSDKKSVIYRTGQLFQNVQFWHVFGFWAPSKRGSTSVDSTLNSLVNSHSNQSRSTRLLSFSYFCYINNNYINYYILLNILLVLNYYY